MGILNNNSTKRLEYIDKNKKIIYSFTNETFQKHLFMEEITNMTKKKVTITQVAKHAGVAVGTVSNYLNGTVSVSSEKTERIRQAIEELDYIPDALASSLRRKNSKTIYVLTPNLRNAFYTNTISALMEYAYKSGYAVNISGYEYSAERERKQLRILESCKPGSVVIIFNGYNDEAEIRRLVKKDMHVILADRQVLVKNTSSVNYDNHLVMFELVSLLKEKGYQTIGLVAELTELENIRKRRDSFVEAMQCYGFEEPEKYIYAKESLSLNKLKNSYLYMKEILENNRREDLPDAWIATSDYLAIGIMRAINEKGYRIPEDFGVVGFDNLDLSGYMNPRLTTAEQDQDIFGKKLWDVVKRMKQTGKTEQIILPQKIIVRESC